MAIENDKPIKNKIIRSNLYQKERKRKQVEDKKFRSARRKEEKADPSLKAKRQAENVPQTLELKREVDETMVEEQDTQIEQEDAEDEYAGYFRKEVKPKILITTSKQPHKKVYGFVDELVDIFPDAKYVKRGTQFEISHIMKFASERNFTDAMIVNCDYKQGINSLTLIHLPNGPTAYFKLSSIVLSKDIHGHGRSDAHFPELILNNFSTRLGHLVGRMFQSLFPPVPEFQGRQVATLHNQRDFIFFRRHRYAFRSDKKADLQELGPRFTMKLKWLQKGLFDPENGEYEWKYKPDMETTRRRFFL